MADLSDDARKQIEKMALKATEKLLDAAVDNFKETVKAAHMAMDVQAGLHLRAMTQQLDAMAQQPSQVPE